MKQTVSKLEKTKDRREGKGRVIALSRNVYKLQGKDTFHVESESCDSRYYFVRYNPSVFEWCSCKDFESNRTEGKCKHLYAVEYAIRFGTVKEVEHFPRAEENNVLEEKIVTLQSNVPEQSSKSYLEDEYDF